MTRFASRSSGFVLFAPRDPPALSPPLDPGGTSTSEAVPSFHDVVQKGGLPYVCECARARLSSRCIRVCVYLCLHMHIRARACTACTVCRNAGAHVGVFGYVPPDAATANEK